MISFKRLTALIHGTPGTENHITEFGMLRYIHVTSDTYSGFLVASAQTREAPKHVITHCL